MSARVLILGCGDVGTTLGLELAARGQEVWGLRRDAARIPAPIHALAGDLGRPETLPRWPNAIDFVFYTAAADDGSAAAYAAAYVDGLRHVLDSLAAARVKPRRLVYTSSTAVYAQHAGEWVDEHSPTEPTDECGRILLAGERLAASGSTATTVVRLAGIYGPGRTRLIDGVRNGTLHCGGEVTTITNRIHRDDCAGFLAHLVTLAEPARLYVGVDDEPAERCTVYHWLADRLGVPSPHRAAPAAATTRARSVTNKRCSNASMRATGYRLRYPTFREGYAALLADSR